jgi:GTP pyrophosphokinase
MPFDENSEFQRFVSVAKSKGAELDWNAVEKAYKFAALVHKNYRRADGDPYVSHCLAVAEILLDYVPETATIEAALLHGATKNAGVPTETIEREFGPRVASLVESLTKLGRMPFMSLEQAEAENIRKMMLALSKDIRIILIRLVDRLHNLRTIQSLPQPKRDRMAREAIEIYAAIAHKLNLTAIKNELEDLSFAVLWPEDYKHVTEALTERSEERKTETERLRKFIETELRRRGMPITVYGRAKHLYSIFRKMQRKQMTLEELTDLTALRVISRNVSDCYKALSIVSEMFHPIPNTLDDYISSPKPNLYRSLHISLLSDKGKPIEVQIRTEEMHEIAERGVAAHWKYKGHTEEEFDKKLEWMQSLLSWQREVKEASEYIEGIKVELFERGIVVFTPMGDMLELPEGASGVDFAYAIHRDVGEHCDKVKVNGRIVPLSESLKDGDIVEVITSPQKKINSNWLSFVKTKKARSHIKADLHLSEGKPKVKKKEPLTTAVPVIAMTKQKARIVDGVLEVAPGMSNIRLAKCCTPLPGKAIIAVESKDKYSIHTTDCKEISHEKKRAIPTQWLETRGIYLQKLNIIGEDRPTLLSDVLKVVIGRKSTIEKINVATTKDGNVAISFVLRFNKEKELSDLKAALRKSEGIREIYTLS